MEQNITGVIATTTHEIAGVLYHLSVTPEVVWIRRDTDKLTIPFMRWTDHTQRIYEATTGEWNFAFVEWYHSYVPDGKQYTRCPECLGAGCDNCNRLGHVAISV